MAFTQVSLVVFSMFLLSLIAVGSASGYENVPKPKLQKPETPKELHPYTIAVQGLIYCKSGPKLTPLKGALARITCLGVDKYGYEAAPFSVLSCPTDAKGYFLATLSPREYEVKITQCKAFLESSPSEDCKLPTDINKGTSGALLSSYRLLLEKNAKLYSVGTLFYTNSQSKSVPRPNGY